MWRRFSSAASEADRRESRISLSAVFYYGSGLQRRAEELRALVADGVETMTAFNILAIDIEIRGLKPSGGRTKPEIQS